MEKNNSPGVHVDSSLVVDDIKPCYIPGVQLINVSITEFHPNSSSNEDSFNYNATKDEIHFEGRQ
eukprot:2658838-Ditylum_brightwellii.AAC.1